MPPRPPRSRDNRVVVPDEPALPRHPVLGTRQHLIYDINSQRAEAGHLINQVSASGSHAKLAALALIIRLRGIDYVNSREHFDNIRKMMSVSHNDASIVEVAKAMGHPNAAMFRASLRDLNIIDGWRIDRGNDNLVANKYPRQVQAFFETYRQAVLQEQTTFGLQGANIADTSGRPEPQARHGLTEMSPMHVAHLVEYLYNADRVNKGETISRLSNPNNRPQTAWSYLHGRNQPGNGQVFFVKTGTVGPRDFSKLPSGSRLPTQHPEGAFLITIGYIQDGRPKVAFLRADSDEHRKQLANQFLDHVAGIQPDQAAERRPPRPTSTA